MVGASWATVGADHHAPESVKQLQDAGIMQTVTPADVLAKYAAPITDATRRDMRDREFPDMCKAQGGGRWILSLAKVPQDLQTDQTMRHLMGDFARRAAREAGDYRKHPGDEPGLI